MNLLKTKPFVCPCQTPGPASASTLLNDFRTLRAECAAIRNVLVPDWSTFEEADRRLDGNRAGHRSILLLALERGHIDRITSPIHRLIMTGDAVRSDITKQYLRDLAEHWTLKSDELERHQRSKSFMGRLVELQCAERLGELSWRVENLEAWGGPADIEARSDTGDGWAIEVKYIGQEDWDFIDIAEALERDGVGKGRAVSLPTTADFILFKIYTAAHQLRMLSKSRLVLLVISDLTWSRFQFVLQNDFIDWRFPHLSSPDAEWLKFLEEQKKRYPDIGQDLASLIRSLDRVWILRLKGGFEYSHEVHVNPKALAATT